MNEAAQRVEAMHLLLRASELLDRYADVTDGAEGQPQANVAMSLKSDIDAFLASPAAAGCAPLETIESKQTPEPVTIFRQALEAAEKLPHRPHCLIDDLADVISEQERKQEGF